MAFRRSRRRGYPGRGRRRRSRRRGKSRFVRMSRGGIRM